jgi:hypothetical protein
MSDEKLNCRERREMFPKFWGKDSHGCTGESAIIGEIKSCGIESKRCDHGDAQSGIAKLEREPVRETEPTPHAQIRIPHNRIDQERYRHSNP